MRKTRSARKKIYYIGVLEKKNQNQISGFFADFVGFAHIGICTKKGICLHQNSTFYRLYINNKCTISKLIHIRHNLT